MAAELTTKAAKVVDYEEMDLEKLKEIVDERGYLAERFTKPQMVRL